MCSFFGVEMENYQGDLTDIVRASGGQIGCSNPSSASSSDINSPSPATWQFPSDPLSFCSSIDDQHRDYIGEPFSNMRDPLLHELNMPGNSGYFYPPNRLVVDEAAAANRNVNLGDLKSPCNIFSRIQISSSSQTPNLQQPLLPCDSPVTASAAVAASPRGNIKAPVMVASDMINANSSSKNCLFDNTGLGQISSPGNLGIKRRKSQAKKVVCIPAPAPANSRSTGEVVPSDLWAWRKYGQKPIKGSPYPRGYYRCSSSKGCSARKQVERSRTDPNMLVITYTSEHNHPWPTQRNALAGSTRSQPSKANAAAASSKGSLVSQSSHHQLHQNTNNNNKNEEEQRESSNDDNINAGPCSSTASVKEEIEEPIDDHMEGADDEFNEGFYHSQVYKPALPDSNSNQPHHEDFFAELGEIEADPLNLLFTNQGFSTEDHDENKESKGLDPFNIFDWSGDSNNTHLEKPRGVYDRTL